MQKDSNDIKNKKCYVVKIIVIGDQSVGKTNILNRYVKGEFSEEYAITIGMDFLSCNFELDDKIFILRLWDTAGSERFRSVTKGYYSNSCCALIVYDITDENSFISVKNWIEDCQSYADILKRVPVLLRRRIRPAIRRCRHKAQRQERARDNKPFAFHKPPLTLCVCRYCCQKTGTSSCPPVF